MTNKKAPEKREPDQNPKPQGQEQYTRYDRSRLERARALALLATQQPRLF